MSADATWQTAAAQERARLASKIEASGCGAAAPYKVARDVLNVAQLPLEGLMSSAELEITGSSVEGLLTRLRSGEWGAEEVMVRLPLPALRCRGAATRT